MAARSAHAAPGQPGGSPTLTATTPTSIELDAGNKVTGVHIDPQGAGGGIAGGTGDAGGGTIDDVNIVDTGTAGTQPGLELDGTTGTFNITNLTVNTNGADRRPAEQRRHDQLRPPHDHDHHRGATGLDAAGAPRTWAPARSMPSPSPARPPAA